MKRSDAFPSRFLGKDNIEGPTRVIIDDVRLEEISGDHGDEDKPVMFFRDDEIKPMILNNTNWQVIEGSYGEDTDDWRGHEIEIYVDPGIMFGKKRVGGLRIRIPSSGGAKPSTGTWTWEQALDNAAAAGLDKETLIAKMKEHGLKAYNSSLTGIVKEIIEAAGEQQADDDDDESIPF